MASLITPADKMLDDTAYYIYMQKAYGTYKLVQSGLDSTQGKQLLITINYYFPFANTVQKPVQYLSPC